MLGSVQPRRSALYMPGSNARALEKAKSLAADVLLLDLEDAVAPKSKAQARGHVLAALAGREAYGLRELVVRVNGLETAWGHDDLAALARADHDAVLLPKIGSPDLVDRALAVLAAHGGRADQPIWAMIETPVGVLAAASIARHPNVECLVLGSSDLTKDLHARHVPQREPLLASLGLTVLAARAAGVAVLDGVHLDLADEQGFDQACRQGRDFGFDGKTLIHPKQITPANRVFGPDPEALAEAQTIIEAFETAQAQGKGVVVVGGKLVEHLHVQEAKRLQAVAQAIERREQVDR
jgi:citrate lyase subunit beta / citryl-CoA lyase